MTLGNKWKSRVSFFFIKQKDFKTFFVLPHVLSNYLSLSTALILTIFEDKGLGDTFKI